MQCVYFSSSFHVNALPFHRVLTATLYQLEGPLMLTGSMGPRGKGLTSRGLHLGLGLTLRGLHLGLGVGLYQTTHVTMGKPSP